MVRLRKTIAIIYIVYLSKIIQTVVPKSRSVNNIFIVQDLYF